MSPTLGSKSAHGLIASQSTSISDRANARCAATDKSDHHLECHANSTARFKCGGSLRALYFANRLTRLMQVALQRPPISHASVSSTILPAACAASRYVFVLRFSLFAFRVRSFSFFVVRVRLSFVSFRCLFSFFSFENENKNEHENENKKRKRKRVQKRKRNGFHSFDFVQSR